MTFVEKYLAEMTTRETGMFIKIATPRLNEVNNTHFVADKFIIGKLIRICSSHIKNNSQPNTLPGLVCMYLLTPRGARRQLVAKSVFFALLGHKKLP